MATWVPKLAMDEDFESFPQQEPLLQWEVFEQLEPFGQRITNLS
jgi:hypothetical protein